MSRDRITKKSFASLVGGGPAVSSLRVENPSAQTTEVLIEAWGSRLFLLPGRQYVLVAEGVQDPTNGITAELGEPLTLWPAGRKANFIVRDDGNLVWDDEQPSQVIQDLKHPSVLRALRWLKDESSSRVGNIAGDEFRTRIERRQGEDQIRADIDLLLVEQGVVSVTDNAVSLTEWGRAFLEGRIVPSLAM